MNTNVLRKSLVVGIILLFIGVSFTPLFASGKEEHLINTKQTNPGERGNSGKTIYVDIHNTEGPWNGTLEHPFQHINDAVDVVSTGDTIYVFHGYYNEGFDFDFNEPITFNLTGEDKNTTFINGTIMVNYCPLTIIVTNFTLQYVCFWLGIGHNNTIKNCRIGSGGIFLDGSYSRIIDNIFMDSSLFIYGGRGNTIIGNTFSSKGIVKVEPNYDYMWGWDSHIIENNTINGHPIIYYINKINVVVPKDTGQLYLVNCRNFLIEDLTISDVEIGITAYHSSHNTISNCSINNASSSGGEYYAQTGISLHHSDYNTIQDTSVSNFSYGINCDVSQGTNITNCIIQNNYYGIIVFEGPSAFISRCIIASNRYGIWLSLGGYTTIEYCTISQNNRSIDMDDGFKHVVKNNNIVDNIQEPYFYNTYLTKWRRNYWGRPSIGPKIIHGRIDEYGGYFFPGIHTPWINFDWFPALKPYDIGDK